MGKTEVRACFMFPQNSLLLQPEEKRLPDASGSSICICFVGDSLLCFGSDRDLCTAFAHNAFSVAFGCSVIS